MFTGCSKGTLTKALVRAELNRYCRNEVFDSRRPRYKIKKAEVFDSRLFLCPVGQGFSLAKIQQT